MGDLLLTTDPDGDAYAEDWLLLGFHLSGEDDDDDDYDYGVDCATKEQVFSLPCVSRRMKNGDLTQDEAEELWSEHRCVGGCSEQDFADFWDEVNEFPDKGDDEEASDT